MLDIRLGLYRLTYRWRFKKTLPQHILYQRIVALSWRYPHYGCRWIRALMV